MKEGWREKGVREGGGRSVTSFRHVKQHYWPRQLDCYSHSVIHSAMIHRILLIRTAYWPTIGDTHSKQVVGHNTYDIYSILDFIITLIVISAPKTPWRTFSTPSNENKSRSNPGHSPGQRPERNNGDNHLHKRNRTLVILLSRETHSQYQHNKKYLVSQSKTVNYADLRENVHLVYTLPAIMFISFSFLYSIENTILGHMLDKVVY